MGEFRVRASGLLTPTPHGSRVTVSVDTIRLHRDPSGEVSESHRLGAAPFDEDAVKAAELLLQAEYGTGLQSAVAQVRERRDSDGRLLVRTAAMLARLETVAGPVLLGTFGSDDIVNLLPSVLPATLGSPPPDWLSRPILLHPWVAAVVIAGAAFSLTSQRGRQAAQRIAGKRVLPGLTLTDLPEPTVDYRGPAEPSTLVDRGRIRVAADRVAWDHDAGGFDASPVTRLELAGPLAVPSDALELVWCVEGLQRYHSDGVLRLHCLAHAGGDDWFLVRLSGKPIHLLRGVRGVCGPEVAVYTDSEVLTRSLVLSCAAELENVDVEL